MFCVSCDDFWWGGEKELLLHLAGTGQIVQLAESFIVKS